MSDEASTLKQLLTKAETCSHNGHGEEAIQAWRKLEDLQPHDPRPAEEAAHLIVARARRKCGLDSNDPQHAEEAHDERDDTAVFQSRRLEVAQRLVQDVPLPMLPASAHELNRSPLQQLEHANRECPSDTEIVLHLAKSYLENDREYNAEQLLEKHFRSTDKSPRMQSALEEVQMLRMEQKVDHARQRIVEEPSEEAQAELDKYLGEQDRMETRIFRARCDREPNNAALQLELGRRLGRGDKLIDASRYFAKAVNDPATGPAAAWEAGRCFERMGDLPQAMQYYRLASDGARRPGHEESGKSALLAAARLAQRMKLIPLAIRYVSQLLSVAPKHAEALELKQLLNQLAAAKPTLPTTTDPANQPPAAPG